ncbi:MAG: SMC-Scp complex subunit ScpB [Candidatus Omnitrophica bacterium]|nr:SMC-Scp complex subunit ScpB [Candidatus Omnitrophota bacterium]
MDEQVQSTVVSETPAEGKISLGMIENYKSGIEALLFVSDKPIVLDQFKTVFPELKPSQISELVKQVQDDYGNRNAGMVVVDIAQGWQMLSNSRAAGYIREFYKTKTKEKLSRASLESIAIIAYKQPVSRADLEVIRGVNCDGTVAHLLNKGLIEIVGRKEVPGRPFLYGTTKAFLEYFGLKCIEDLPKLENVSQLVQMETIQQADSVPLSEEQEKVELKGAPQEEVAEEAIQKVADVQEATQESSGQSRVMQEEVSSSPNALVGDPEGGKN